MTGEHPKYLNAYTVVSAKEYSDKLVINVKSVELELESYMSRDTYKFFYLVDFSSISESIELASQVDYNEIKTDIISKYSDDMNEYEMTFLKEDGKYYYSNMIRVY